MMRLFPWLKRLSTLLTGQMMDDRMRKKYIYFISVFLFFLTPICKAEIKGEDLAVGIALINSQKLTVSTTQKIIKDKSIVVCPLNDKKMSKCLNLSGEKFNEVNNSGNVSDVVYGSVIHEFSTDALLLVESGFSVGIAFIYNKKIQPTIKLINNKEGVGISVGIGFETLVINSCNSSEGIHVYSSYPNEHLYYPYGYNISETCSNEIYQ